MQNTTFVEHNIKQTQKKTYRHCSIVLSGASELTKNGKNRAPTQITS